LPQKPTKKLQKKRARWTTPAKPKLKVPVYFRFLDLPPELRDMIYDLALLDPSGISLVSRIKDNRRTVRRGAVYDASSYDYRYFYGRHRSLKSGAQQVAVRQNPIIPRFLRVNKQIYAEGINFLYGQDFYFEDMLALQYFLATIGRNTSRLTSLTIKKYVA
jgi:hypothetical protein